MANMHRICRLPRSGSTLTFCLVFLTVDLKFEKKVGGTN
jgi:hypothetical protein